MQRPAAVMRRVTLPGVRFGRVAPPRRDGSEGRPPLLARERLETERASHGRLGAAGVIGVGRAPKDADDAQRR